MLVRLISSGLFVWVGDMRNVLIQLYTERKISAYELGVSVIFYTVFTIHPLFPCMGKIGTMVLQNQNGNDYF